MSAGGRWSDAERAPTADDELLTSERARDTMGAGYFYNGLSGDFQNLLDSLVPLLDLWSSKSIATRP